MGFLVDKTPYERTYPDPDGGQETLTVTLRPLDAGDRAHVQDRMITARFGDDGEGAEASVHSETTKLLFIERALVSWTLPISATAATIRSLDPRVVDLIYADVQLGNKPPSEDDEQEDTSPLAGVALEPAQLGDDSSS